MNETKAEKIVRLQSEIAERQSQLQYLVCGDPRKGVLAQPLGMSDAMRRQDAIPVLQKLQEWLINHNNNR